MFFYRKASTIPLDTLSRDQDAVTDGTREVSQLVYEEIGDVSRTFPSTRDMEAHQGLPEAAAGAAHAYEDVELAGSQGAGSADSYRITLCSAYGVSLEHGGQ